MDWALNREKQCHQNRYSACLCGGFILVGKRDFKLIMTRTIWKHGTGECGEVRKSILKGTNV